MSTGSQTPSRVPSATFAAVSRSGVIWGLDVKQLGLLAVALGRPAFQMAVTQDLGGALWSLLYWTTPLTVLAVGSFGGRSFLERTLTVGMFAARKLGGQTTARVKIGTAAKAGRLMIPGAVGDRMHVLDIANVDYGVGAVFLWDAVEQTATAVLQFTTNAWELAGDEDKTSRAGAVSHLCQQITDLPGVTRVTTHARTYPASEDHLPAPRISEPDPDNEGVSVAGRFAQVEHDELLADPRITAVLHRDVLITITISATKAAREIAAAGGGVAGVSAVMSDRVKQVAWMLPDCGVRIEGSRWLDRAQIMGALRLALDPAAAPWLEANDYRLPDDALLVTVLREQLDHVVTDSGFHRTWWVERPPAMPARAGFLTAMIAGGQVPHTVTQIWEPITAHQAEKRLVNAEASRTTAAKVQDFLGKPATAAHTAEGKELELRRKELELGFGDVNYSILITVHARTLDELTAAEAWVRSVSVGMSVKVLRGQQWSGFTTAALPLGLGVRR